MRSFYKSFIASSVICLSLASASSVLEDAQTSATSSTSLSATTTQVTPQDDLTSFTDRLKVVRAYYGGQSTHSAQDIVPHLIQWHDQDARAIRARLSAPTNQSKLDTYRAVAARAAGHQKLTFDSLGVLYLLYAQLQSDDLEPRVASAHEDAELESLLHFVEHGTLDAFLTAYGEEKKKPWSEWAAFAKDPFYFQEAEDFLFPASLGARPLPMVSEDANATFRELNESFGLGTPLAGDPLKRSCFDGNMDVLPEAFIKHDLNHARQLTNYKLYRTLNQIVYEIKDPKRQYLSDFVLFEVGHEQNFFGTGVETSVTGQTLTGLVHSFIDGYRRDFQNLTQSQLLEKDRIPTGLMQFVDPGTGKLNSLESMIRDKKLPQDRPLQFKDFFQGAGFKRRLGEYTTASPESFFHSDVDRLLANYNKLLELEGYFQKNGLPEFKLWKDGKFDSAGILGQLEKAGAVFLEEVGSKL